MNKILPGLFIGSIRDSRNHDQLKANSITHIVSIHDTAKGGSVQGVQYLCISAADSPSQNLSQFFPQCNDFIHSSRLSGGNVLIHCLAGASRSVTVVVAYLMSITSLTSKEALDIVRTVRTISDPNPGFQKQLQDFETFRVKQERSRLSNRFPGQIPRKSDETELHKILAHNRTVGSRSPRPCLARKSTTGKNNTISSGNSKESRDRKVVIFYSPNLPRRFSSSSSAAKEF